MAWTEQGVERWLTKYPLPRDFTYNGQVVWPRYVLKKGYGQWLRTAGSYYPKLRGLWRQCCDILIAWPVGKPLPTPEQLAGEIRALHSMGGALEFAAEGPAALPDPDDPDNVVGRGVNFAAQLRRARGESDDDYEGKLAPGI